MIKLDMEKAYDTINWNFIFQVMTGFGFSNVWINYIKACISNCWFTILVNGESVGFFQSKRGIRQGDPLSPLIFVIAADYFSRSTDRLFFNNPAMFYKFKKKVKITHLAYADDILIFLNASKRSLYILKNCFAHYERVSGRKINDQKSSFILHKPTAQIVDWIQRILGFNKTDLPVNYLGVPLWKGFQNFNMYGPLIFKIQNKILTWNHRMLSTGGRLELINSVLNSIAFYNLQVIQPPDNVITFIERLFNKFLWGSNDNKRKLHWASWNRLSYPPEEGGLGCRDLHDITRAAQIKLWWRFRTTNNIWSDFLNKKYCSRLHPMLIKLSPKSSHIWKNMCGIRSIANYNIFWNSGNGKVSFWHDNWCEFGPLSLFQPSKSKDKIEFFWTNGQWDRNKLISKLPVGICDHICSYPCGPSSNMPVWTLTSNGDFSYKSTWELVRQKKPTNKILTFCWNSFITPTISIFMVRLFFKWIPTTDGLLRRGIIANNLCYCCNGVENMAHLFIHGPVAKVVWNYFQNLAGIDCINSNNINHIINNWFSRTKGYIHIFHIIPILILWFLWCCRNDKRVDNVPFTPNRVCKRIWSYIDTFKGNLKNKRFFWKGAEAIARRAGVQPGPRPVYKIIPVRWLKPAAGWWKLNTDGASRGNPGEAASGGILRDNLGTPSFMFSEFLGERSNNYAELYAIWRGLDLCVSRNFVKVWLESDSNTALHLIKNHNNSHWKLLGLLTKIWNLMDIVEVRFSHIFREGNAVADWLANEGCHRRDFFLYDANNISRKLRGFIKLDKMSYPYIRSRKTYVL
ncbi:hypothetical protein OROHE_010142 [Orobanche hederae]